MRIVADCEGVLVKEGLVVLLARFVAESVFDRSLLIVCVFEGVLDTVGKLDGDCDGVTVVEGSIEFDKVGVNEVVPDLRLLIVADLSSVSECVFVGERERDSVGTSDKLRDCVGLLVGLAVVDGRTVELADADLVSVELTVLEGTLDDVREWERVDVGSSVSELLAV